MRLLLPFLTLALLLAGTPAMAEVDPADVPKFRGALGNHAAALRGYMASDDGKTLSAKDKLVAKHLAAYYKVLHDGKDVSKLKRADLKAAFVHLAAIAKVADKHTDGTLQELYKGAAIAWGKLDQSIRK